VDLVVPVPLERLGLVVGLVDEVAVAVLRSPLTECGYTQSDPVDE